jgi:hypothetical protein
MHFNKRAKGSWTIGYKLAMRGEIPTLKFGVRIIVPKAAIDNMMDLGQGKTGENNVYNES